MPIRHARLDRDGRMPLGRRPRPSPRRPEGRVRPRAPGDRRSLGDRACPLFGVCRHGRDPSDRRWADGPPRPGPRRLGSPPPAADRPPAGPPVWVGTGSCAATACHGGRREPSGLKGSEYSLLRGLRPPRPGLLGPLRRPLEADREELPEAGRASKPPGRIEDDALPPLPCPPGIRLQGPAEPGRRVRRSPTARVAKGATARPASGSSRTSEYGWKGPDRRQKSTASG